MSNIHRDLRNRYVLVMVKINKLFKKNLPHVHASTTDVNLTIDHILDQIIQEKTLEELIEESCV
jgi:hypothetical protein